MKYTLILASVMLSTVSFAQDLSSYNGDYKLNFSVSACNPNARVEVAGRTVKIINQDQRDNRGWSTQSLTEGTKQYTSGNRTQTVTVSKAGTQIIVETKTGSSAYVKDTYTFSEKNGRKALMISLAVETRGNVVGWGTTCGYEKQ